MSHSMRLLMKLVLCGTFFAPAALAENEYLNYESLTHELRIQSLRAGNHNPSGTNNYIFKATMYALINQAEERNAALETRKKTQVDLGEFGATTIKVLSLWQAKEKGEEIKALQVDGHAIRELTAGAMREFKTKEDEIVIMIEVTMLERNKRFFFFGDDVLVAKANYFPVPPTKFDTPLRTNQELSLTDDKGTYVKLTVAYTHTPGEN